MKNNIKAFILTLVLMTLTSSLSCVTWVGDGTETTAETERPTITQYLPETPENSSLPAEGVYIVYRVNSSAAGWISGESEQDATDGKTTSAVTATTNLGYKFVYWSDGSTDPSRSGDTAESSEIITAVFDYDILDLPLVLIDTEAGGDVQSKTEYITAGITMFEGGQATAVQTAQIRGRGNNTWGYPKKSYKIKFSDKQRPFGLGTGDDRIWVLLANQCDQSLLRNHFAFELARGFDRIDFAPSSTSVEVYLNGEYRGVYLLAEEIKVSNDRVNVEEAADGTETGFLVELSSYASGDWIFNLGNRQYQVRSDLPEDTATSKQQFKYIKTYIKQCWEAVRSGSREEIEKYMDLDAYVDTYLVEEITKNLDLGWDSYYLHKDIGGKLVLGPMWDFDLSFGNSNEGCEYYTDIYAGVDSRNGLGNPWYIEASKQKWFRELVTARWDEVYDSIVSPLPSQILAEGRRGYGSYCRNFLKWQIFGTVQNRETHFITSLKNYTEHYEYFAEWAGDRIEWLNDYYRSDAYINGEFITGSGNGSASTPLASTPLVSHADGAPDGNVYGNDATQTLMDEYADLTDKLELESADADGFDGEGPENLFDGDASTKYCYQPDGGESEIYFSASEAVTAYAYVFRTANDTSDNTDRNPDSWILYGRNSDAVNWVVIDEVSGGESKLDAVNYTCFGFDITAPAAYKFYKLLIKNDGIMQLSDIILLGNTH